MRDPVRAVTRSAFVAFSFYLGATASAAAQTATPGVDCSLLTPTQAQGLVCAATPMVPMTVPGSDYIDWRPAADTPAEADCYPYPDPYTDGARAARCSAWQQTQRTPRVLPTFTVGATYVHPYPQIRMVVLAVSLALDGVPVVTAQFTGGTETGQVFAFRVDQPQPWQLVP